MYQVSDEKTLEEVCFRFYGRSDAVIEVLRQRPELAFLGRILEPGSKVDLPDLVNASSTGSVIRLWE